jgi:ElaB/YqjD/DUF883 family membrane-anchored ribosome-binding protein
MSRYETPEAVKHDFGSLAEDARALLVATAESTDERVTEARRRLETALNTAKGKLSDLKERAVAGAHAADTCVREYPYQSIAIAFGVGAVVGFIVTRK